MDDRKWFKFECLLWPDFVRHQPSKSPQEWCSAPTTTANQRTISESVMVRARAVQIVPGIVRLGEARFSYKSIVRHGHGLQIVPENGKFNRTCNKILRDVTHGIGAPLARGATTRKMATRAMALCMVMMTSWQAVPLKVNWRRLWLRNRERTKTTYFTCSNSWFLILELTVKWSLGCIYRRK